MLYICDPINVSIVNREISNVSVSFNDSTKIATLSWTPPATNVDYYKIYMLTSAYDVPTHFTYTTYTYLQLSSLNFKQVTVDKITPLSNNSCEINLSDQSSNNIFVFVIQTGDYSLPLGQQESFGPYMSIRWGF